MLELSSITFTQGSDLPRQHTCDGGDRSPPFAWRNVPAGTASFALICEDPDAPAGTWDHWVIFNLPAGMRELQAGIAPVDTLPMGARQGKNGWGTNGYRGPCPPKGPPHRYVFRLYALDSMLDLPPGVSKSQVLEAMSGHVLGEAELMGRYARS